MQIEVRPTGKKEWYVRLRASNGRVLMHSETYKKFAGAAHLANKLQDTLRYGNGSLLKVVTVSRSGTE